MNHETNQVFTAPPPGADIRELTIPPHSAKHSRVPRDASPAVEALRSHPASADDFWSSVTQNGTPLIEGHCSNRIYTFMYRGEAETVALVLNKIVDDTTRQDALFERIEGTDVWAISLRLGSGWRGSYQLAVVDGAPPELTESQLRELEQRQARSLAAASPERHPSIIAWYKLLRHVRHDPLAREKSSETCVASGPDAPQQLPTVRSIRPGHIVAVDSSTWWYVPAEHPDSSKPRADDWNVLVLLDGDRWVRDGTSRLDDLIATNVIPNTAVLLMGSDGMLDRITQLTCNPHFVERIEHLLANPPTEVGPVTSSADRTTIAGQSLGGLTALYAQCLASHRFGASVCQSGSFWWPNPKGGYPAEWLTHAIAASDMGLGRIYLEVGTAEWVLLEPTRRLHALLEGRCESLSLVEFDGGHDVACWEVSLASALQTVGRL